MSFLWHSIFHIIVMRIISSSPFDNVLFSVFADSIETLAAGTGGTLLLSDV